MGFIYLYVYMLIKSLSCRDWLCYAVQPHLCRRRVLSCRSSHPHFCCNLGFLRTPGNAPPPWIHPSFTRRWKREFLYVSSRPSRVDFAPPVHRARKFSQVLGHTSEKSCKSEERTTCGIPGCQRMEFLANVPRPDCCPPSFSR